MKEKIEKLRELMELQCLDDIWQIEPYMHGLANGLILAMATLDGVDPEFLKAPEKWIGE